MNPTTTTPDYIKQRAEAEFPYSEHTVMAIIDHLRDAYIKGCTDTLEGSVLLKNIKVDFQGPTVIADDTEGYLAVIEGLAIVETGDTKKMAFEEAIKSLMILLAYKAGIKPVANYREAAEGLAKALEGIKRSLKAGAYKQDAILSDLYKQTETALDNWESLNK